MFIIIKFINMKYRVKTKLHKWYMWFNKSLKFNFLYFLCEWSSWFHFLHCCHRDFSTLSFNKKENENKFNLILIPIPIPLTYTHPRLFQSHVLYINFCGWKYRLGFTIFEFGLFLGLLPLLM